MPCGRGRCRRIVNTNPHTAEETWSMLNEPTTEKLTALRLHGMRAAWEEQHTQAQISELGFDERFGLLVEAEHLYRDNLRLTRLLREAKLKLSQACVEDIDYPVNRELDRALQGSRLGARGSPGVRMAASLRAAGGRRRLPNPPLRSRTTRCRLRHGRSVARSRRPPGRRNRSPRRAGLGRCARGRTS